MGCNNERTLQRAQQNRDYSEHPDYWRDDYEVPGFEEEEAEDEVDIEDQME